MQLKSSENCLQFSCNVCWSDAFHGGFQLIRKKTKDDIDAENGLLKEEAMLLAGNCLVSLLLDFSRIIAKPDAQSSELPSQAIKFGIRCITLWLEPRLVA